MKSLFMNTITEICKSDYNHKQIEAWISDTKNNINKSYWQDVLTKQFVLIAQQDSKIVGFASLKNANHIDLLYVHKNYQRQGIANQLYSTIEFRTKQKHQSSLTSEVSKTAKPFFEKQNFSVVQKQIVRKNDVSLVNYKMIKSLDKNKTHQK